MSGGLSRYTAHFGPGLALAAPIAALLALRSMTGTGPTKVSGESLAVSAVTAPSNATALAMTPEQTRALDWARSLQVSADVRSPFGSPHEPQPVVASAGEPGLEESRDQAPAATPGFTLSSIMGSGSAGVATIDGKVTRIGDRLEGGWVLSGIDSAHRCAVLVHDDGRTLKIKAQESLKN